MAAWEDGGGGPTGGVDHFGPVGKYVGLAALERAGDTEEVVDGGGLLGGVTVWHLRILCESGWEGGAGYTPEQVGRMTLDQVFFRLCDRKMFRQRINERTEKMETMAAAGTVRPYEKGFVRGRAKDGTPIKARIVGKSLARRLAEEQAEKARRRKRERGKKKKN